MTWKCPLRLMSPTLSAGSIIFLVSLNACEKMCPINFFKCFCVFDVLFSYSQSAALVALESGFTPKMRWKCRKMAEIMNNFDKIYVLLLINATWNVKILHLPFRESTYFNEISALMLNPISHTSPKFKWRIPSRHLWALRKLMKGRAGLVGYPISNPGFSHTSLQHWITSSLVSLFLLISTLKKKHQREVRQIEHLSNQPHILTQRHAFILRPTNSSTAN